MERSCDEWDDLILSIKMRIWELEERLVAGRTEQWHDRVSGSLLATWE